MGSTSYSTESRSIRSKSLGYTINHVDTIFTQNKERKIHESMDPKGVVVRECRDSEVHPNSIPIIIALDVTGSMGRIPHEMIKEGLPTMMNTLLEAGLDDASVLFLAVGDHTYDRAPLQVGQFESGDEELDMWLTRTWLESGGGANNGESYNLAWYFAARHTVTDSMEKRNTKGFLFTIGDEPVLPSIPKQAIAEIMGATPQASVSTPEILKEAQQKYNVFHLHLTELFTGVPSLSGWQSLLGQQCVEVKSYKKIAKTIADIVISHQENKHTTQTQTISPNTQDTETIL